MYKIRKVVSLIILTVMLSATVPAFAGGDPALLDTFQDSLYGVLIGSLIGGATVAFTKKPANHLINIGIGAGIGAIGGAAFGLTKALKTLVEIEDGKVKFAMPTIVPELVDSPSASGKFAITASLFRVTY